MTKKSDQEWLEKALLCYEQEKSKNPEYLSFDDITIKTSLPDASSGKSRNK